MNVLQEGVAWLAVVPALTGLVVSARFLGRSRWAPLLLGGFALQVVVSLFYRVATALLTRGMSTSTGSIEAGFLAASLLSLAADVAIVAGVAGLLTGGGSSSDGR